MLRVCVCVCFRLRVLFTLADLDETGFGVPWPRHGRKLLYWFLCTIQYYDNNIYYFCNPDEDYGFHLFENKEKLLPDGWKYYTVGNLKKPEASFLRSQIQCHPTGRRDESNTDRLIVGVDGDGYICSVHVSEHYNRNATYQIHPGLCNYIRNL